MSAVSNLAFTSGTSGSSSPLTTSVGALTRWSSGAVVNVEMASTCPR